MSQEARRRRAALGGLVLLCLLLLTVDSRQGPGGPLDRVQGGAVAAFAPLVDAVDTAVAPVRSLAADVPRMARLREEHAALRAEHEALRARMALLAELERENEALRGALDLRRRVDHETVAGRVVGRAPGASSWTVLIDVGAADGVEPDMAVVAGEGLVGRVGEVAPAHASVQLATSPDAGYAVRVGGTGQQALLSGRGDAPLELVVLDEPDLAVPAGSAIVTRGFEGSSIPDGIPVGVVTWPSADGSGRPHEVEPHVDAARLDLVLVVVGAP